MVLDLDILVPALIPLMVGLLIHSFIIVINVNDWLKGRSVTPVDQVVTCLGISRMCDQFVLTLCMFMLTLFKEHPYAHVTLLILAAVFYFCCYANIWLTSLLSIVFCLKISTLHTRLFLYLRRMIDWRTAHCIVGSGLISAGNCLLSVLPAIIEVLKGGTFNTTMRDALYDCTFIGSLYSHTITGSIPVLFFCISSILLFSSLYHHITKMKKSGNLSINLETYYSAMRFVAVTFTYNVIFLTGHFASIFYYYLYCINLPQLYFTLGFLPSLHSSYLIYRTAKLRSQMSKVLHNVIGFLFKRKDPETREEIEVAAR